MDAPPATARPSPVTSTGLTLAWPASTDSGGSGLAGYEVTQAQVGSDALVLLTSTGNTLALTGLLPERTYQFSVRARDGAGNRSTASPTVSVTTPAAPAPDTTAPTAPGTPTAAAVTATGLTLTSTLTGWTLGFSFPSGGQQVGQGWSATYRQTGTAVTATNLSYNGTLAPGASTSFGFNGTHTGSNPRPTTFTLNGVTCATA
ncbi:cellulose binding domain-containing protein [Micromonospora purpureochromogenes]|uniref:cellulose binding domain-containing protein n=1 Tax=Micromonospora purpureochromogenes TaxID=47872 RepID=UPI0033C76CAC